MTTLAPDIQGILAADRTRIFEDPDVIGSVAYVSNLIPFHSIPESEC